MRLAPVLVSLTLTLGPQVSDQGPSSPKAGPPRGTVFAVGGGLWTGNPRSLNILPVCCNDPEVAHQTRGMTNLRREFRSDGRKIAVPARTKPVAGQQLPHLSRREHSANRLAQTRTITARRRSIKAGWWYATINRLPGAERASTVLRVASISSRLRYITTPSQIQAVGTRGL